MTALGDLNANQNPNGPKPHHQSQFDPRGMSSLILCGGSLLTEAVAGSKPHSWVYSVSDEDRGPMRVLMPLTAGDP